MRVSEWTLVAGGGPQADTDAGNWQLDKHMEVVRERGCGWGTKGISSPPLSI